MSGIALTRWAPHGQATVRAGRDHFMPKEIHC